MKKKLFVLLAMSLLLTYCVPSLHPLYTEKDLILDDRIIGKWDEGTNSGEYWIFSKDSNIKKGYLLELTQEDGKKHFFTAHLVKLGNDHYLDFYPRSAECKNEQNDHMSYFAESFYEGHLFPIHTFAKIDIKEDGLVIRFFDHEWIEKLIKESKIRIKHEKVDNSIILTASTTELQKFILKYAQEEKAFSEEAIFERIL